MDKRIETLINNGMNNLARRIDLLARDIKKQKPPIVNVAPPEISVNVPDVIVPEIKLPEFGAFPEVKLPKIQVTVPEIKLPTINVPKQDAPIVNIPPADITVMPTPVTFPLEMKVTGMDKLIEGISRETPEKNIFDEVSSKHPLPMIILDSKGKQITNFGGDFTAPSIVGIRVGTTPVNEDNPMPVTVDGFAIPMFDQQIIDESLAPATTTITYRRNGSTVAVKTIIVDGTTTTISVI